MASLGTAYIKIAPDLKGVQSSISRQFAGIGAPIAKQVGGEVSRASGGAFNGLADKAKSVMATIGKTVAVGMGVAAVGVGALVKGAVSSFAEYEQLVGGVETLFKGSSNTVMNYANNAYKSAGLSANQYMETVTGFSASLLQSLGGDTEKAARIGNMAVTDMADNANKMGTSMESIQYAYQGFAKQNYTMLDNLKLGYGGTKTEMQRLLADAEKMPQAMGRKFDLSNYSDVVEAINVVQQNMGITGTTALEASNTIQGSTASMKAAWHNVLTGIADDTQNFPQLISNLVGSVGDVMKNLLPTIKVALSGAVNLINELAPLIIAALPSLIGELLPALIETAVNLVNAIVQALPQLIQVLLQSLPIFIQGVLDIAMGILKALPQIINIIVPMIPMIVDTLVKTLTNPEMLSMMIMAALDLFLAIIDAIPQVIVALVNALPRIIDNIVTTLTKPEFLQKLSESAVKLFKSMISGIGSMLGSIGEATGKIFNKIIDTFKPSNLIEVGKNLVKGLWNGISDMAGWIGSKIKGFGDGIMKNLKDFFGIHSPSRVMRDQIGKMLIAGLGLGMDDEEATLLNQARGISSNLLGAMNTSATFTGGLNSGVARGAGEINQTNNVYTELDMDIVNRNLMWEFNRT